ncbi:hypothetical protein TGDOM2_401720, partial [Toxoplasma gondii GAB2-2007-GAL-DOM2]
FLGDGRAYCPGAGGTVRAERPCFICGSGAPRGPTALWHELSTCGVWRRLMGRLVRERKVVAYLRGWVRGYWLCVVVQSVSEIVERFFQGKTVTAIGPTSLGHDLSTCWVWRRHMVRPLY